MDARIRRMKVKYALKETVKYAVIIFFAFFMLYPLI